MELIINNTTYTLRPLNSERRALFVDKVLSYYNFKSKGTDFNSFMKETKEVLLKEHNIDMSLEQVIADYFKEYTKSLYDTIWAFLIPEDKKQLKQVTKLNIAQDELQKFIETISNKIKFYSNYIKSKGNNNVTEDIHAIYSHLSRIYGWTFEEIKEMDELELVKAIENSVEIMNRENVTTINSHALVGAYASGNKKAKSQIDSMNRSLKRKSDTKNIPEDKSTLTREQLKDIMEGRNNG